MLFNSIDFAIFLPRVFILYWFIAKKSLNNKRKILKLPFLSLPTNLLSQHFNQKNLMGYKNAITRIGKNFSIIAIDQNLFTKENYRNIDHMNNSGALIATKEIIKKLKNENK